MSSSGSLAKENSFVKNRAKLFDGQNTDRIRMDPDRQSPSYVTLSCTVNGYNGYTCYDSKARQDIRSRDSSRDRLPLVATRSRDPSPKKAGLCHRMSSGFLVSVPNGVTSPPTGRSMSNRSKSVDRSLLRQNFLNGCSDSPPSPAVSNWHKSTDNLHEAVKLPILLKDSITERGRLRSRAVTTPVVEKLENKSLIQQRIERLYGPGALARNFFKLKTPQKPDIESNNNQEDVSVTDFQKSPSTPPVFRHLNPEFRQQLFSPKSSATQKQVVNTSVPIIALNKEELPGTRFLKTLDGERKRLECRIQTAEESLRLDDVAISEEIAGKIHAALGKCRLLMAQKFEQFAGLCRKNLHQSPEEPFPTTEDDLAGFWDMVKIQVEHIDTLFAEIDKLRDNGWKEVETMKERISTNKAKRPPVKNSRTPANSTARSAKAQEAARAREEARKKMMEEKKRLMRERKTASDDTLQSWIIEENGTTGDLTNKLDICKEDC